MGFGVVTYWEFRRLWNHLRTASKRPVFLIVQVVSFATIGLVMCLLWFFMFAFPVEIRGVLYRVLVETGLVGPNAVFLVYAVISVLAVQALLRALFSVPLSAEVEPADVDLLFLAPIQPRVLFAAKYVRSIPRRLLFLTYCLLAFSPALIFLGLEYGVSLLNITLLLLTVFLLGEIGAIATHALYFFQRLVEQSSRKRRLLHLLFYGFVSFGTLLLLIPGAPLNSRLVPFPVFGLASLIVGLGTNGGLAPVPPGIEIAVLGLLIVYLAAQRLTTRLCNAVGASLYEDLSVVTRQRGVAVGLLAGLPIAFRGAGTPLRALLKKDILMGLRSRGKAFYLVVLFGNFALSFVFISLSPVIHLLIPVPAAMTPLIPDLYLLLLVLLVPLLAIGTSDPFRGEYGCVHLIRLAQLAPLKVTMVKFGLLLITPIFLAVPFAIYFAVILGSLSLLLVAVGVLPYAILISASVGTGLGSRYPYVTRTSSQTPVALLVTYPVLSWLACIPVVFVELQLLHVKTWFTLVSAVVMILYVLGIVLFLLTWAARSFLSQE